MHAKLYIKAQTKHQVSAASIVGGIKNDTYISKAKAFVGGIKKMTPDTFVNLFSYSKYIILMKLVVHNESQY